MLEQPQILWNLPETPVGLQQIKPPGVCSIGYVRKGNPGAFGNSNSKSNAKEFCLAPGSAGNAFRFSRSHFPSFVTPPDVTFLSLPPVPSINYNDSINFLRKLTFRRAWNATKVVSSFYVSRWLKKPIQWGIPLSVSFEPTTSCNLRCPECPSGLRQFSRPKGMLDSKFFKQTIDSIHKDLMYLIFYFQGEPYLNKNLPLARICSKGYVALAYLCL